MRVYVLTKDGNPLMPCKPAIARLLLKDGKAVVKQRTPFTIQLNYKGEEYKQEVTLGIDSGYEHTGLSAVTVKEELYASEVQLRKDIVKLNSERRSYRRTRRNRKTRYRAARWLNRRKPEGWIAPSLQHKLDSHIKVIAGIYSILPVTGCIVEVANFDIQKIKNPDIEGRDYQEGNKLGFWNTREYVLHRDGHICRHCKGKSKDKVLNVHHLTSRQTGGNKPDNLITLCNSCHKKYHRGDIILKAEKPNNFRGETFMSSVRWKLVNTLNLRYDNVSHTYGHITKNKRIRYNIKKSHINDAFIIAGGTGQDRISPYLISQVRRQNRKLYKGSRSHIRNTASRYIKGFQRYDKILFEGQKCFIFGRRRTGYFDLRKLNGDSIHRSASYKNLKLLERAKTLLIERSGNSSHTKSKILV
ncbi:MAG: RNA-guided endonuclease IscB [Nitrospirota bacterium]